jgi:hypothetical protein
MNNDPDFQLKKYNLLRNAKTDNLYPTKHIIDLINPARNSSKGAWYSILQDDELISIMVIFIFF